MSTADLPAGRADVLGGDRDDGAPTATVTRRVGWAPYLVMAVVLAVALVIGADRGSGPPSDSDRVFALSRSIQCPVCDGQAVAESEAVLAKEIRRDIARRVDAGETDEQIRAYYASTYGDDVLLVPPSEGVGGLVWVVPVAGGVVALLALALVFRRWTRRPQVHATDADRDLVAQALGEAPPVSGSQEATSSSASRESSGSGRGTPASSSARPLPLPPPATPDPTPEAGG